MTNDEITGDEATNEESPKPVLVIGAGIAGVEASLLLADSGRKVYLVERASYFGGNVIKWEEVFPNMECSTCMLAPKQQELLAKGDIELLTLSEVESVQGAAGDFKVKVRKKARYVDLDACIGCGACYEVCPVEVDNDFEENLSKRKAIYVPCPGALPNVPAIDTENCLRFQGQECELCKESCLLEAVDYEQQDEEIELNVGAIVVATGFDIIDLTTLPQYGYKKFSEVYSTIEYERLRASNGPTKGELVMRNGQPPKSAAIIHCVGRPEKGYCSSVCCMSSLKIGHYLIDKIPAIKVTEFYSDLCVPGKSYQKFYESVKEHGINFIRGTVTEVAEQGKALAVNYETEDGKKNSITVDVVILAPAIVPRVDSAEVARMLDIPQGEGGFFSEQQPEIDSTVTPHEGIFIAGCAQGPKDVQSCIAQAEAVVGKILSSSK
jgi:heterodisulfide reductase subunit A